MRKTTGITWLLQLLSLGFLFHGVCSVDSTGNATAAPQIPDNVTSVTVAQNTVATTMQTPNESTVKPPSPPATISPPTDDAGKNKPTDKSTQPTAAVATIPAVRDPTPNPMVPTQPPNAPGKTAASATVPTVVKDATTNKVTPGPLHTTLPAPTSGTNEPPVGATVTDATVEPPVTATPGKTSGAKVPVVTPPVNTNVGTTQNAKVRTDTPSTSQRSMVDTTVTAKTGQEGSQGGSGTDKMTVTDRSLEQTPPGATQPTGNMDPTSSPPTPAKPGPSATLGTFTAKAGPTLTTSASTSPSTPNLASGRGTPSTSTPRATSTVSPAASGKFSYSLNNGDEKEEKKELVEVCKRLLANFEDGNCTLAYHHPNGKIQFDNVEINGKVKPSLAAEYYNEINKKPADNKTLIAILASCGALLIMIVILAVCASHHRKPYNENQQHLTEELHTVENGYHDNPTLEVMEVQPEMQEKKTAMNGEFSDSWIVPIDNLLKEDIPDEEDTHL